MKNCLLLLFIFGTISSVMAQNQAFSKCSKNRSLDAAIKMDVINGYKNINARMVSQIRDGKLIVVSVETYTGNGGGLYSITLDQCKVIKSELIEDIDR